MKKIILIILALFIASCGNQQTSGIPVNTSGGPVSYSEVSGGPDISTASILSNMEKGVYKEGELLVRFRDESASFITHQAAGASVEKSFGIVPGLQHVKLPEGLTVRDAIVQYMADPNVEYAEPNYIRHTFTVIPNDTYFNPQQWALHNMGEYAGGSEDADIDAPEAWAISTGSHMTNIAIIDTGIDYNHSDLVGNVWMNSGETDCLDGIDNDGNGYIDDCRGWDFIGLTNDPMDDYGHGTHVAGTVGAVGDNGNGVAGVMWTVNLMALKAFNSDGSGAIADILNAINYATANGARVINASFGGSGYSASVYDAINAANSNGVLFIAAAGNGAGDGVGDNNDFMPSYPASYDLPNIISVAATDQNDERVPFSNYGLLSVDVAAPGVYIWSTLPNWYTGFVDSGIMDTWAGTSMSAPHVAGVAGLLFDYYDGVKNTGLNHWQVRQTILDSVDPLDSLNGWIATGGRINAYKALSSLLAPTGLTAEANPVVIPYLLGDTIVDPSITLTWKDNATGEDGYIIERRVQGGLFEELLRVPANTETYKDDGLDPSTMYIYQVIAYKTNINAESFPSNDIHAVTLSTVPAGNGSGCSIVAGQTAPLDVLMLLIPAIAIFASIVRRKR